MQTLGRISPHRAPRRQRGLLGLVTAFGIALLMSLGVLVVDMEQLRVVRAKLQDGMAACESDASGDRPVAVRPQLRDAGARWTAFSEPFPGTTVRPMRASAPVSPLQQAALDFGVAFGCYVKKQLAAPEQSAAVPLASASLRSLPQQRPISPLHIQ